MWLNLDRDPRKKFPFPQTLYLGPNARAYSVAAAKNEQKTQLNKTLLGIPDIHYTNPCTL